MAVIQSVRAFLLAMVVVSNAKAGLAVAPAIPQSNWPSQGTTKPPGEEHRTATNRGWPTPGTAGSAGAQGKPENQGTQGKQSTQARPTTQGPGGAATARPQPGRRVLSDFEDPPRAVVPRTTVRPAPGALPVSTPPSGAPARRSPRPLAETLRSHLRPIFEGVGFPSEMRELGGVIAKAQISVFNHQGGVLADVSLVHTADLAAVPPRDRLEFGGRPSVSRVYGRDGDTVFAERYGLAWQQLEQRAREELAVFGLLLRFPWAFAGSGFLTEPAVTANIEGRRLARVRVRRRPQRGAEVASVEVTDRFDLFCDPGTMVPEMVQMTLVGGGGTVTVLLRDYFAFGSISVPRRRIFVGPGGKKVMEVRILAMERVQRPARSLFRPRR